MNQKLSSRVVSLCLWMAALLCSTGAAVAAGSSIITFQVDMTPVVGNGQYYGTNVSVHGTFNGWGSGFQLTNNPGGANPNLFSGTLNDTGETNGAVTIFKYVYTYTNQDNYESLPDSQNRCFKLPTNSGGSLNLPLVFFNDAGDTAEGQVTFQVDMSEQVNIGKFNPGAGDYVEVHGSYDSWSGGTPMTAESGNTNIWSVTIPVDASTNSAQEFKFVTQPGTGWEGLPNSSPNVDYNSGNRYFANFTQTLPVVFFNEVPFSALPPVTNNVTFVMDMSVQQDLGTFTNSNPDSSVEIHGDFNNWGAGITLTNNPGGADPLLYSTVIQYVGTPGTTYNYKFVLQPGTQWENVPLAGGNRQFTTGRTNGDFTIGPLYYSFEGPSALDDVVLVTNCMVTFTIDMNGAKGNDGTVFDPNADTIWINGLYNGLNNSFWTWGGLGGPAQFQMTNIPGSTLYTTTLPVNPGQNINLVYKYGINGADNEAGFADNHMRYIRSYPNYTMPTDVFGAQGSSSISEPSFGNLTIGKAAGGVSLSWLGRQHVHLETATSLTSPVWTPQIATDGTNLIVAPGGTATTNYPVGAGNTFYRLVYP